MHKPVHENLGTDRRTRQLSSPKHTGTGNQANYENKGAKFPHSLILYYACRSLLTENNVKNNTTRCGTMRCFCCFLVAKQRTTYIELHA